MVFSVVLALWSAFSSREAIVIVDPPPFAYAPLLYDSRVSKVGRLCESVSVYQQLVCGVSSFLIPSHFVNECDSGSKCHD